MFKSLFLTIFFVLLSDYLCKTTFNSSSMKFILIFSVLAATFGCSTAKETSVNPEKEVKIVEEKIEEVKIEEVKKPEIIVGRVMISKEGEGCPLLIEAFRNGEMFILYPLNLIEKYKVDGLKIKFTFTESKALLPDNCKADVVGVLENTSPLY